MEKISLDRIVDIAFDECEREIEEKFEDGFDTEIIESNNDYDKLLNIIEHTKDYYELDDVENMNVGKLVDLTCGMVLG